MYLDRICLTQIIASDSFKQHIRLEGWQSDWVKGAFFWAYALAQVPAGWLSDRFGARLLISFYIAAWSIFTMATSFSVGFVSLMLARLGCGLAEAGYYPASSGLLTRWAHVGSRGFASSMISWGGRVGGAIAPGLTALVIVKSGDWRWAGWIYGALGIGVAWAYWRVFREHPRLHPKCNDAEIALLAEGRGDFQPVKDPPKRFPFVAACRSGNLWLANGVQFFTNIGWAFLVLSLHWGPNMRLSPPERYRSFAMALPGAVRDVHAEHTEIFHYALAGQDARAALALEAHIRTTPDLLIQALRAGRVSLPGSGERESS